MADDDTRYACLWIPLTGLFLKGAYFTDGEGRRIPWNKIIPLFKDKARADEAARKTKARYPIARGEVVVVRIIAREVEDSDINKVEG